MPTIRERDGRFQAIVRIKSGGTLVHTETRTFPTRALAASWASRVEAEIKRNGVTHRKASLVTLGSLIDAHIKLRTATKPLGRATIHDLDMLVRYFGEDTKVADIGLKEWIKFSAQRSASGASPSTVMHNLATARAVWQSARALHNVHVDVEAIVDAIAAAKLSGMASPSKSRERRVSDDELDALVREFKRIEAYPSTMIPMSTIVSLAVVLPRRLGELCDMRWSDYDAGVITLRDTKHPRTPRTERVPVQRSARAIIDSLPRVHDRILPYKPDSVSAAFTRAVERLGLIDMRFHDLRHEGICRLFEAGLAIQDVSLISGHTSWSTLRRYTHLKPEDVLGKLDARA